MRLDHFLASAYSFCGGKNVSPFTPAVSVFLITFRPLQFAGINPSHQHATFIIGSLSGYGIMRPLNGLLGCRSQEINRHFRDYRQPGISKTWLHFSVVFVPAKNPHWSFRFSSLIWIVAAPLWRISWKFVVKGSSPFLRLHILIENWITPSNKLNNPKV